MTQIPHFAAGEETHASPSSSTLSLLPPTSSETPSKRRLLLVYIHGFMGSEASFSDFPAHVHNSLTDLLSETHVIYTRIYPRYKSRGEISTAVENFRSWLSPHTANDLDVILLGHSLGGIVAADVALLSASSSSSSPSRTNNNSKNDNRNHILGLINFDVPFLGLHPHVIPTGIRSLLQQQKPDPVMTINNPTTDPNTPPDPVLFDPPFINDVHLVERNRVNGIVHFIAKNNHHLMRSVYERFLSPYRFAGCLNNYVQLRRRYKRLMRLERGEGKGVERVRFVNYYTMSTGVVGERLKGRRIGEWKGKKGGGDEDWSQVTSGSWDRLSTMYPDGDEMFLGPSPNTTGQLQYTSSRSTLDLSTDENSTVALESSVECNSQENTSVVTHLDTTTMRIPPKLYKFVLMPSHHWKRGDNSLWVPVRMENMDEVTAHQSMFVPHGNGRTYDQLVGEVVSQIEGWVKDDLTARLLRDENIDFMRCC